MRGVNRDVSTAGKRDTTVQSVTRREYEEEEQTAKELIEETSKEQEEEKTITHQTERRKFASRFESPYKITERII